MLVVVNLDIALSRASVQIPIHGGGLSIGQARRAGWRVGGLQAHAAHRCVGGTGMVIGRRLLELLRCSD
jgi:hypothetical protein